jgi:hypothetical protein
MISTENKPGQFKRSRPFALQWRLWTRPDSTESLVTRDTVVVCDTFSDEQKHRQHHPDLDGNVQISEDGERERDQPHADRLFSE